MTLRVVCAEADMKVASSLVGFLKKQNIPAKISYVKARNQFGDDQLVLWSKHLAPFKKRLKDLPNSKLVLLDVADLPPELSGLETVNAKVIGQRENVAWRNVVSVLQGREYTGSRGVSIDPADLPEAIPLSVNELEFPNVDEPILEQASESIADIEPLVEPEALVEPELLSEPELVDEAEVLADPEIIAEPEPLIGAVEDVASDLEALPELEPLEEVEELASSELDELATPEPMVESAGAVDVVSTEELETPVEPEALAEPLLEEVPVDIEELSAPEIPAEISAESSEVLENIEPETPTETAEVSAAEVDANLKELAKGQPSLLSADELSVSQTPDEALKATEDTVAKYGAILEEAKTEADPVLAEIDDVPNFSELEAAKNTAIEIPESKTYFLPIIILVVLVLALGAGVGLLHPNSPLFGVLGS